MAKSVAIVQSNYIPWKGYFDLISRVDEFVLLDDVQYTRRDWRNRNRIMTPQGPRWLTIPVEVKGKYAQRIRDTRIADPAWAVQHWRRIEHAYRNTPHFTDLAPRLERRYMQPTPVMLSDVNRGWLEEICDLLGIDTPLRWSWEFDCADEKSQRLLDICLQCGATTYLSGPAARTYLDVERFARSGIDVRWMDYSGYPPYPQLSETFVHEVSIVDLLFNTGPEARNYIRPRGGTAA